MPWGSVEALPSFGGIEKYSSSSRSTIMACLVKSGFWDVVGPKSGEGEPSKRCCWAANRPGEVAVP